MMMHWLRSNTQHHLLFNLYCPCSSDVVPRAALVTVVEGSLHSIEEEPQNQHDAGTVKTSVSCPIHPRIRSTTTDDFVFTSPEFSERPCLSASIDSTVDSVHFHRRRPPTPEAKRYQQLPTITVAVTMRKIIIIITITLTTAILVYECVLLFDEDLFSVVRVCRLSSSYEQFPTWLQRPFALRPPATHHSLSLPEQSFAILSSFSPFPFIIHPINTTTRDDTLLPLLLLSSFSPSFLSSPSHSFTTDAIPYIHTASSKTSSEFPANPVQTQATRKNNTTIRKPRRGNPTNYSFLLASIETTHIHSLPRC